VSGFLQEPAVIFSLVVLASVLLIVEAAPLPTFGGSALVGIVLLIAAIAGIAGSGVAWWPLVLVAAAVVSWGVMLARRSAPPAQQGITLALFVLGGCIFGILATDVWTVLLALGATGGMTTAFPALFERSTRLLDQPAQVGMDALVGAHGTVARWEADAGRGTVRVHGSLWSAVRDHDDETDIALSEGAAVVVTGYQGMTLRVTAVEAPIPAS
jgi:membrane protein implicated in regulation of membrane protease activity